MDLSANLRELIDRERPHLRNLGDDRANVPRGPGKWSPKQELGHLIDSAANNHLRFAGAATASEYRGPGYAQEAWVRVHGYDNLPWDEIVGFWFQYNRLLAHLIDRIPAGLFGNPCTIASNPAVTLEYLIEDYVVHMQHHLDLLLLREEVTPYPR